MKKTTIAVAACAMLLGAAVALPGRPANVAVIDLQQVLPALDEQKYFEARAKQVDDAMAAEKDRLARELQDLTNELDSYKPGTPAYNEALKKVEAAAGAVNAQDQFGKLKSEAERASCWRDLIAHVKEATAAVAKEQHLDVVLSSDAAFPIEQTNLQGTRTQLLLKRVFFMAPEFDVSEAVAARANADFKQRGGILPPVVPAPGAPTAPAGAGNPATAK
jgi:hypothetical protein